jgi:hypothetical protein
MKIELRRALEPGELGATDCGLCGALFEAESIIASVIGAGADLGLACPSCVAHFGEQSPERFPTIEEYEEAKRHYPAPVWPTPNGPEETFERDETEYWRVYEGAWLPRSRGVLVGGGDRRG